jgi:mannosylglycoprotein endo-beta-mannosidase
VNSELDKPFTEEETNEVVFQMEKNKAAGADDFPIEFFQNCWELIKNDMMRFFTDFHQHKVSLNKINYGIITIIPKSDDASVI